MSQKQQLLIANVIIENLRNHSMSYEDYFEFLGFKYYSDQRTINIKIAEKITERHQTHYIYGMFPEKVMNISSIINILPAHTIKTTTVQELSLIIDWIKIHRLTNLSEIEIQESLISSQQTLSGYCLTSVSKIFGAEFIGYDDEKIRLNKLVATLQSDLIREKKANVELQENFTNLSNTLETQNAIIHDKLSLSWT
jgi:hypothetical protein